MIDITNVFIFFLILTRITSFFVSVPIFSAKGVPAQYKIGLSFFMALLLFPSINQNFISDFSYQDGIYIYYLIQETLMGIALGWIVQLIFSSIQIAGIFIDLQNGFGLANIIDPQTGIQSPLSGNFMYTFAILLFLSIDGHHNLIDGILSSYKIIPLSREWIGQLNNQSTIDFILYLFSEMFVIAFKIASPIVVSLLLADIALGIIARTVPQLNVFVVGLPMKILIYFILMLLVAPGFIYMFKEVFKQMIIAMKQFMDLMGY
ncbi:flagellar biosynthetic protein FliR [Vulcanibacillus modesticaldus]|uniref:Flagellar biosynthetic protein FliR n=1 Tax=Vulcanibacillus modesticaldus TaxID=337097 RepID=A0A1D2YXV7_9BACI|nr:flagellar biosynthetic protein FliR [Vulcanibacillus modesticaldus]OEG00416.1 flagellar biosynthetic protein FliR [Vulcanibacillus modesticaldus]